jgi:hypothetical protein
MLRGELMKKYTRILVAITFLLGLGVAANAEMQPVIAVNMPFEFVVGEKTLPAGAYVVTRSPELDVLMITGRDNGTSVFLNSVGTEDASGCNPNMSVRKVGEQLFLGRIQTASYVYNFRVPRSVTLAAAAKQSSAVAISGSGGSN